MSIPYPIAKLCSYFVVILDLNIRKLPTTENLLLTLVDWP